VQFQVIVDGVVDHPVSIALQGLGDLDELLDDLFLP
jgi:hypothetical protein